MVHSPVVIPSDRTLKRWTARARKLWPLWYPVRVVRVPGAVECVGSCRFTGAGYVIEIWRGLCKQATNETLIHEWTHAALHDDGHPNWGGHCDDFWVRYGEHYRAWHRVPALDPDPEMGYD